MGLYLNVLERPRGWRRRGGEVRERRAISYRSDMHVYVTWPRGMLNMPAMPTRVPVLMRARDKIALCYHDSCLRGPRNHHRDFFTYDTFLFFGVSPTLLSLLCFAITVVLCLSFLLFSFLSVCLFVCLFLFLCVSFFLSFFLSFSLSRKLPSSLVPC